MGLRDGLTFKELAKRSGICERTLRRWNKLLRRESAQLATPEREERAFVELVERSDANSPRIEVVLPGERRIVLDAAALLDVVVRVLTTVERC